MNQRNSNGTLGLFVGFIIMLIIVSLFIQVLRFFFPLIAIIVVAVIFWRFIRKFIAKNRKKSGPDSQTSHNDNHQQHTHNTSVDEPIDVEYTVLDDEDSEDEKKNDR